METTDLLDELFLHMLEKSGAKHYYSDRDMFHITFAWAEVLLSKAFDAHAGHITKDQMAQLATELGETIHELVLAATKVDTKKLAKKLQ